MEGGATGPQAKSAVTSLFIFLETNRYTLEACNKRYGTLLSAAGVGVAAGFWDWGLQSCPVTFLYSAFRFSKVFTSDFTASAAALALFSCLTFSP